MRARWEGTVAADGTGGGGTASRQWVLDCDTTMFGVLDEENLQPKDAGKLNFARWTEERCKILEGMGAKCYNGLQEYEHLYEGSRTILLRAWEWKLGKEHQHLVKI